MASFDRPADPLGIVYEDPRLLASSGAADIPKNELDKLRARAVAPLDRASESGLSRSYTDSLEQIAEMLSVLPGRKDVVLFSEGAGIRTALLTGSDAGSLQRRRSAEHGEIWSVASDDIYGWTHLQNRLEGAVEKLRRSGAVVHALYTISPVGAADIRPRGEGPWAPTILLTLAHDTGGDLYENRYDLGEAIRTILERTEVTYLLTVQLDAVEHDGAFRKIKVKLAGAPRGARVAYRKGYFNPRPFAEIEPAARQLQTAAMILGTQEGGDLGVDVWAAPLAGSESLALVPYLVEIDGKSLLAVSDGARNLPLEIVVYALGSTGRVEAFLRQTIGIDLERSRNQLEQGGIKYWGHLNLPPGEYSSRVLVRNTRNGMGTLRTVPVHVPTDLKALFLSPAEIPDAVGRWAVIFEPENRRSEMAYPFQIGERSIVPAAFPLVPSTGTTEVYWRGVDPSAQGEFSARLVDADGSSVNNAKIFLDSPPEGSVGLVSARLETRDVAPGEYSLVGSLGRESVESTLPIQVQ